MYYERRARLLSEIFGVPAIAASNCGTTLRQKKPVPFCPTAADFTKFGGLVSFTACLRLRDTLLHSRAATKSPESAAEPRRPSALASTPSSGQLASAPGLVSDGLEGARAHPLYRWPRPVPRVAAQAAGAVLKLFSRERASPTLVESFSGQRRRLVVSVFHHGTVRGNRAEPDCIPVLPAQDK